MCLQNQILLQNSLGTPLGWVACTASHSHFAFTYTFIFRDLLKHAKEQLPVRCRAQEEGPINTSIVPQSAETANSRALLSAVAHRRSPAPLQVTAGIFRAFSAQHRVCLDICPSMSMMKPVGVTDPSRPWMQARIPYLPRLVAPCTGDHCQHTILLCFRGTLGVLLVSPRCALHCLSANSLLCLVCTLQRRALPRSPHLTTAPPTGGVRFLS